MPQPTLKLVRKPALDLAQVSRRYQVRIWRHSDERYRVNDALATLDLHEGRIVVNEQTIIQPRFERNAVTWTQKTATHFTAGVLHFTPDGLAFSGAVSLGADEASAVSHTVSGAVPPTVYSSKVAKTGAAETPTPPTTDDGWTDGVTVTLGYELDAGGEPTQIIKINDVDALGFTALAVDPATQNLRLFINYDPDIAPEGYKRSPRWPTSGQIEFSWDGLSFAGTMTEYDPAAGDKSALQYAWKGNTPAQPALTTWRRTAAGLKLATRLAVKELSVTELQAISPEGVQGKSFEMLVQNMKWAMKDDWRTSFFSETKPDLNQSRIDLIKKNLDFYTDKFAPAYLGWGFANMAGPGAPQNPLDAAGKKKLHYYMSVGLAQEKGYNAQSQGLFLQAFIASSPRLQEYIKDGGENWAHKLYDAITTVPMINQVVNQVKAAGNMERANRYAELLTALQPSGQLARQYLTRISLTSMIGHASNVNLDDPDAIMEWLPHAIQAFIDHYLTAPDNPTKQQLALAEAAKELKQAAEAFQSVTGLARAATEVLVALKPAGGAQQGLWERLSDFDLTWGQRYPKLAKLTGVIKVLAWSGGIYGLITGFKNWDQMKPEEKTALIATTVQLGAETIAGVPGLLESGKTSMEDLIALRNRLAGQQANDLAEEAIAVGEAEVGCWDAFCQGFWRMVNWIRDKCAAGVDAFMRDPATGELTRLGKFMRGATAFAKIIGVLVTGVLAGVVCYQFAQDLMSGAPLGQQVLDGVSSVAAAAETICLAVGVFVESVVLTVCTAVFAIIGLVAAIVLLFLPQPQPESPVDKFMNQVIRPFVAKLDNPPADWTAPQTKKTAPVALAYS